jgi:hypothetical protein
MQAIAAMQSDPDFAAAQQACAFFRGSPREDVCYRTRIREQRMGLVEMWRAVLTQQRGVVRALPAGSNALECGHVNGTYTCAPSTRRSTVITRANPDGTITYQVPQTAPSPSRVGGGGGGNINIELERAREAYTASLEQLKTESTCSNCRQEALRLGRIYRGMTREDGKVTIYDETAIANDINAAAGGR